MASFKFYFSLGILLCFSILVNAQRIASDKTAPNGIRTIATNAMPVYNGKLISVAASAMIKGTDTAYFIGFYKQQLDVISELKKDPNRNSCTVTLADGTKITGQYAQLIQVPGNDIFSYHFTNEDFKKLAAQNAVNASFMSPVSEEYDFKILNKFQDNIKNVAVNILAKLK